MVQCEVVTCRKILQAGSLKKHIKKSNIFRRELPHLFKADGSDKSKRKIVEEKL